MTPLKHCKQEIGNEQVSVIICSHFAVWLRTKISPVVCKGEQIKEMYKEIKVIRHVNKLAGKQLWFSEATVNL